MLTTLCSDTMADFKIKSYDFQSCSHCQTGLQTDTSCSRLDEANQVTQITSSEFEDLDFLILKI
jgi:hypothetical protein